MKSAVTRLAISVWIVGATLALGRWWYAHPAMFPTLPPGFWNWLDGLFGANNVDGAADVEFLTVLVAALVVVCAATWLAGFAWRRSRR